MKQFFSKKYSSFFQIWHKIGMIFHLVDKAVHFMVKYSLPEVTMRKQLREYPYEKEISALAKLTDSEVIRPELYPQNNVMRGLRDADGKGVLCGLTEVSEINAFRNEDGRLIPMEGELYYRGINVKDLVSGCVTDKRFGFEECTYLLLFGKLPAARELEDFRAMLADLRRLPRNFVRDVVMKSPSHDIMNMLARCVLNLYSYDKNPDDVSIENVLRQSLTLIAQFPLLAVYSYRAHRYASSPTSSLVIHKPVAELSTAENILHMLRKNNEFTDLEAKVLDTCLILHAEHGGGNNSTFTNHVVTSSGTDTYSAVASSLVSLKGPKHGGANIKVVQMFENIRQNVKKASDAKLRDYLYKILNKQAFDQSGLIYGMGHAVYSLSDPRAEVLKLYAGKLAAEQHKEEEFEFYNSVARIATELISEQKNTVKAVSPNVDFYSGFVYTMLALPKALFTPMFAISRISGWSAHRIEELLNGNKIIRPAYKCVLPHAEYVPLSERK